MVTWCVSVCACVFMCVCEVRSVAVLSDGRVCSPPPHLIESAGLRPRLFQPQLIECICTRLHNDRWVSPQLPFFFLMFSKNDKAGLCFLAPLSLCISVCLFFLCLFLLPNFPKIGVGKKKKKKKMLSLSAVSFISLGRRRRRRGRIHLADVAQFVFHIF